MPISIKNAVIDVICYLYITLFVYAATSKILDYSKFRIQLGQSPILSPFADWISFLIPFLEYVICLLLVFRKTRFFGLLSSFVLMVLFSFYIYIILHYSTFIPCSCGGILEKMKWKQHLIFNVLFTAMAGIAFLILPNNSNSQIEEKTANTELKMRFGLLVFSILSGGILMITLFNFSEDIIHYKNKFIRRFPQHVAQEIYKIDLNFNSYYFAGSSNGKLYLGNYTAPLKMLVFDTVTKTTEKFKIDLKQKNLPFSGPKIRVFKNDFFVFEGTVPYVFKGSVSNWQAGLRINSGYFFSHAEPMDSTNLAIRYLVPKSGESALGNLNLADTTKAKFDKSLLEKQFDGIFDTDGSLLYNQQLKRIIYVYYYRNEYFVIKPDLKLDYKGNTIDTISHAQVSLIQYKNSKMKTFAKPPLTVNKTIATYGNLLYVNSLLPGLYENEKLWRTASMIDVYDLSTKSYRSSFPIYDVGGKKVKAMLVYGSFFYALIDDQLVCYKLRNYLTQNRAVYQSIKNK